MATLTLSQLKTLMRFKTRLPNSWPGLPYHMFEQNSIPPLERMGLVESVLYKRESRTLGRETVTPCFRLTAAGKAALAKLPEPANDT
jgi:hypothetical protein